MRTTIFLLLAALAPAQTKVQAIAAEIEADAKRENPRLGLAGC